MANLEVQIDVNLSQFKRELAKLPAASQAAFATFQKRAEEGEASAKDVAAALKLVQREERNLAKEATAAGKAQEKAARKAEKAMDHLQGAIKSNFDTTGDLVDKFGQMGGSGVLGDLFDMTKYAGELGATVGPIGAGIAVIGVGAAVAAVGMATLAIKAGELLEEVQAMSDSPVFVPIPDSSVEGLEDMNIAFEIFADTGKNLVVLLGGPLGKGMAFLALQASEIVVGVSRAVAAFQHFAEVHPIIGDIGQFILDFVMGPLTAPIIVITKTMEAARRIRDEITKIVDMKGSLFDIDRFKAILQVIRHIVELTAGIHIWKDDMKTTSVSKDLDTELARRKEEKAQLKALEEAETAARAVKPPPPARISPLKIPKIPKQVLEDPIIAAQKKIQETQEKALADLANLAESLDRARLEGTEKINNKYNEQIEKVKDLLALSGDLETATKVMADLEIDREKELRAYREAEEERRRKAFEAEEQRLREAHEEALKREEEAAALRWQRTQDYYNGSAGALAAFGDLSSGVSDIMLSSGERVDKQTQRTILTLFRAKQVAALGEISINAAVATMAAWKSGNPVLAGLQIAAILATAGASTAQVVAQRPPEFFAGRAPDELPAVLHRDEAVLNARAVRELNAGGGGAGVQEISIVFNGRTLDKMMVDTIESQNGTRKAIARRASASKKRNPWG